jgi:hypothetical protein
MDLAELKTLLAHIARIPNPKAGLIPIRIIVAMLYVR